MPDASGKTHTVRKKPRVTVKALADYMAASEQTGRRITRDCKFRSTARVHQHTDAKLIIADFLANPKPNAEYLYKRLEGLEAKICDDPFDYDTNQHNCDYVARFMQIWQKLKLPDATFSKPGQTFSIDLRGTVVSFAPEILAMRITSRNTVKRGAIQFRYSKGHALNPEVGSFQSAFALRYLTLQPIHSDGVPERGLCLTVDVMTGAVYEAPTDSTYRFKEMAAACETIAERWERISPPPNAII